MTLTEDEEAAFYEVSVNDGERRMIAPPVDGEPSARFPGPSNARDDLLWDGYLEASQVLLRACMESERSAERLISPALFNLRHALEVALKYHIQWAGGVVPKGVGHNLDVLADAFRKTAKGLPEEASYVSEWFLGLVSEVAALDPQSTAFRYSTERNGHPIETGLDRIGLVRLLLWIDLLKDYLYDLVERVAISWDEEYLCQFR